MLEAGKLVELLLNQSPACHWVVRAERTAAHRPRVRPASGFTAVYSGALFEHVWGNSAPLFGKPLEELRRAECIDALSPDMARIWCARFDRALQGESLMLQDRRGKSIWYVSVFPLHLEGKFGYVGGIGREITPWRSAEQELRQTVMGAIKAQEFERTMMSRFLHDSVGQNLTALGLQLDLIRMDVEATAPEAGERVAEVQTVLGEIMESVRGYSYELDPATVERAGLRTAMDRLASRARERFSGVLRVNVNPSLKIESVLATAIYKIAQEAVENALRHSGCSSLDISVKTTRTGMILEVRDNGRGFDPDDVLSGHRGLGLLSMEHYAAQAGLDLSIVSTRDLGTTVRATKG